MGDPSNNCPGAPPPPRVYLSSIYNWHKDTDPVTFDKHQDLLRHKHDDIEFILYCRDFLECLEVIHDYWVINHMCRSNLFIIVECVLCCVYHGRVFELELFDMKCLCCYPPYLLFFLKLCDSID